jgi:hypothetical protein
MKKKDTKENQTIISVDKAVLAGLLITLLLIVLMMISEIFKV